MKVSRIVALSAGVMMMIPTLSNARTKMASEGSRDLAVTFSEQALGQPNSGPTLVNCEGVQLDEVQKAALKVAHFDFMKKKNTLEAVSKNAWIDYGHTLADPTSTKDQGTAAAAAVKDAMVSYGSAKTEFELNVFYDILKPEQREPALICIMAEMKKKMTDELKKKCALMDPKS